MRNVNYPFGVYGKEFRGNAAPYGPFGFYGPSRFGGVGGGLGLAFGGLGAVAGLAGAAYGLRGLGLALGARPPFFF